MDFASMALWTTNQLVSLWTAPHVAEDVANVALGVTANGVYDVVKRFFNRKPVAAAVLEQAQADPKNLDNLQDLTGQIARLLNEDPAFRDELAKLVPSQVMQSHNTQDQKMGDNSTGVQNIGSGNSFNIKS